MLRKTRLSDQGSEDDWRDATPEQRMRAVWQMTLDTWAMLGDEGESRLLRHVVRIVRGKR